MDGRTLPTSKSIKNPNAPQGVPINVSGISSQQKKEEAVVPVLSGVSTQQMKDVDVVTNVFSISGLGVDEKAMALVIPTLVKWNREEKESFRKDTKIFDKELLFERLNEGHLEQLEYEFLRFMRVVVLWTMHPWERDARLIKDALSRNDPKSYNVVIEIACTRKSEEFLGVRRAYHSLFGCSIEEDIYPEATLEKKEEDPGYQARTFDRKLLLALVSTYRYEGRMVHEDIAKSEAETLHTAIKNRNLVEKSAAETHRTAIEMRNLVEEEEVVRILSTRSEHHLKSVFKHYSDKFLSGKTIDEDVVGPPSLKQTVQCLSAPQTYFSKVLDAALKPYANENAKEGLVRVIATRADVDIGKITDEYRNEYGVSLAQKIEQIAKGNFKDFLLTMLARGQSS
ncbi:hypothetical protein Vadar_020508 [Vaccinium darrowii]|uniref:Uncharacterized protein n=1 Tax=Vaccinium darrowii TaxID=229202 RepID=A0ACB7ZF58_9ERIC|nr:hypothetical protein Vadar_020508 [Vaccinium darrowii]